jgi:electron transfer flavoprotein alpha/beta subunit
MKIVVFIKQVPENTRLRFQDGQLVTEGIPSMMNPFDEYALEMAIRLKEQIGGDASVTAVSLGVPNVKETLKKAIAAGADAGLIVSDRLFDGDSATVSLALAAAVKKQIPDFGILLFGQLALDDAAAQVGPRVASLMNIPSLTLVKNAEFQGGNTLKITRETLLGIEDWTLEGPGALCVMKCDYELRSSNIKGVMKANKAEIPTLNAADLGLDTVALSAKTTVLKSWQRPAKSEGKVIAGENAASAVTQLMEYLHTIQVI